MSTLNEVGDGEKIAEIPVKSGSRYVVMVPDGKSLYVSHWSHGEVSVIDVLSEQVVTTIGVGALAGSIAVSHDGKFVTVCTGGDQSISIIDTETKASKSVSVGMIGFKVAFSTDGKFVYVTGENFVAVDVEMLKVFTSFTFQHSSDGIAVTPDGLHAWVSFPLGNNVSLIDLKTFEIKKVVTLEHYPGHVAINKDGSRIFVGVMIHGKLAVIDSLEGKLLNEIVLKSQPYDIALSLDESYAYVCSFPASGVEVVDLKAQTVDRTIEVGREPRGIAVSLDGEKAYVTNSYYTESKLSVISLPNPHSR